MLLSTLALIGCVLATAGGQGMPRTRCSLFEEQPPNRANTSERLSLLRAEMRRPSSVQGAPLEAYIITSYDPHLNEQVADRDRRLEYISGFTGSIGTAVITMQKAALWTADLYLSQADQELSCDWLLMNESMPIPEWLSTEVQAGLRIGADPRIVPNSHWERLSKKLNDKSLYLIFIQNNLVDLIWTSKPNYTFHEATLMVYETSGDLWFTKVGNVRAEMKKEECDALIVTALDEIAWLLNIRGKDIPYLPVLRSYLILSHDHIFLYTDRAKINEKVRNRLRIEGCYASKCVRLRGYDIVWEDIATLSQKWNTVCLPTETSLSPGVSRAIFFTVPVEKRKSIVSPILELKSVKNIREQEGMRKAHLQDAVAMCYTMSFIHNKIKHGEKVDELLIANLLKSARMEREENEGISFKSIVAFGPHGAFPHYEPKNTTSIEVNKSNLLLIDSGGQYIGGTTDVSRTFHFGTPTEEQIDAYTRVLKGHIDLAKLIFPESVTHREIDILARAPLWDAGKDYIHDTGHGIGSFLSVHEGPILVSRSQDRPYTFQEGNFFSVEPGYYKENEFGIRLESILEVVSINMTDSSKRFLKFDSVTLVPFEPKLINVKMLSPEQIRWLNDYNKRIRDEVGAELKKHALMGAFHWMMEKVRYISERTSNSSGTLHSSVSLIFFTKIALLFTLTNRH